MMKKIYLLACVLLLADVSFGRGCLEGFNNVAVFNTKQVGDIIVSRRGTDDIFITRERFIRSVADTTLLNTVSIPLVNCTHNITREVQAGANIDLPFADINADRNRIVNANLIIEQGNVVRLADGQMAYWDVLRALPHSELQNIRNAMRRGSRFSMVTQLVYAQKGHTEVTWRDNINVALNATAGRTEGGSSWNRADSTSITITYDSITPTSVGFISMPISRRQIRTALQNEPSTRWASIPFGIHQFCNGQTEAGVAFAATQGGALISSGVLARLSNYNKGKLSGEHLTQHQYDTYLARSESQAKWAGNLLWVAGGSILINYVVNIISVRNIRRSNLTATPMLTLDRQGNPQTTMAINFQF